MTEKAFAYCRVSGLTQATQTGLERQQATLRRFAYESQLEIVGWYQDTASGTLGIAGRPELSRLFKDLMADGVSTILIEDADRWARDLFVGEGMFREFRAACPNVKILAAKTGVDLACDEDPDRVMMRQILGAVAQNAKAKLVQRLWAGKVRSGRYRGPGTFYSDEQRRRVVKEIRIRRHHGWSCAKIAKHFTDNPDKYPKPVSGSWSRQYVSLLCKTKTRSTTQRIQKRKMKKKQPAIRPVESPRLEIPLPKGPFLPPAPRSSASAPPAP